MTDPTAFDWSGLAFGSKKPVNSLSATFIAAPREISEPRFAQLVKTYLPEGNVILGLAKEPYVLGFENQPQFRTLDVATVQAVIDKVTASTSKHKVYTLHYFQRELRYILEKLDFRKTVFINGSWKYSFHTQTPYYVLVTRNTPYELVSPFTDEAEAKAFAAQTVLPDIPTNGTFNERGMLEIADRIAKHSYDYGFQTGVALGRRSTATYKLLARAYNSVLPYQTYAMHYGASRETNFSPPNDLNYYDTTHAEVELLIKAQRERIDLHDTTMFINLLPCPACARMISRTDIAEIVYREDHSDGYAVKILELSDKKVRRHV